MPLAAVATAATIYSHVQGEKAAKAQGDAATAKLNREESDRVKALEFAEASPQELENLNRSISLNQTDIERKQKLLDSSDPAIIEAGEQALKLLRGEEAKTLAPLRNNIAKQELALREKLQAQLGPGYENTTAGIQALNAFNEQANNALAGAQQSSLAQLLGVAQDSSARYGMQSNIQNSTALGQLFGNIQERKISAITKTPINNAGAQFVQSAASARNNQQTAGQLTGLASTLIPNTPKDWSKGDNSPDNPYFVGPR